MESIKNLLVLLLAFNLISTDIEAAKSINRKKAAIALALLKKKRQQNKKNKKNNSKNKKNKKNKKKNVKKPKNSKKKPAKIIKKSTLKQQVVSNIIAVNPATIETPKSVAIEAPKPENPISVIQIGDTKVINERVKGWHDFYCVPSTLYNAVRMEERFGIAHPYMDEQQLQNKIAALLKLYHYDINEGVHKEIRTLIGKQLNLQQFYTLSIYNNIIYSNPEADLTKSEYLNFAANMHYPFLLNQKQLSLLNKRETINRIKLTNDMIKNLKECINLHNNQTHVINFGCSVITESGGSHSILISLVVNASGERTIYINDNRNKADAYSQTMMYVNWIINNIK